MTPNLHRVIATATSVFEGLAPFQNVRLPQPVDPNLPKRDWTVSALWTRDGLRPRWQRLAAIANILSDQDEVGLWERVLHDLSIPLGILALDNNCLVLSHARSNQTTVKEVKLEELGRELEQYRERLFSPLALSRFRSGQLSFSDLEETVSAEGFTLLLRHRAQLDKALESGINGALRPYVQPSATPRSLDLALPYFESVLVVTVAYLGARILEDKGFFGPTHRMVSDPKELLQKTIAETNGFFRRAVDNELDNLELESREQLAFYLGASVAFSLIDHHDVGRLYEKAQSIVQRALESFLESIAVAPENISGIQPRLIKLQQHYTPIAVADQMLKHLPLERLHPDERFVFDPAAGSGSLLLASTRRLASLDDTPLGPERQEYLTRHIAGNDIDDLARLVTRLRYILEQESIGSAELFPIPMPDFFDRDFRGFTKKSLPIRARVIVANPPFAEHTDVQRAAEFVELALTWLSDGDQFAFVLPGVFLTGSSHGIREARSQLTKRCKILESWRLPEGIIGISARQAASVVLGEVGQRSNGYSVARAVLSAAKKEAVRDEGFLGQAWIVRDPVDEDWRGLVAPSIELKSPTKPLGHMFYIVSGVTRDKRFPPIDQEPPNIKVKKYWQLRYKGQGSLWADPDNVTTGRYIRYGRQYLEGARSEDEAVFDQSKVLVGRSVNINAKEPLVARLDTTGFCPDNNVFCICTLESVGKAIEAAPAGWSDLNEYQRLLWLVGILNSEMSFDLSLQGRDSRRLSLPLLSGFDLPARVDRRIVEVAEKMVERDKIRLAITAPDPLRRQLNVLVEKSYGNPRRLKLIRTGILPDLELWHRERGERTYSVIGQVLDSSPTDRRILLHLNGLIEDEQESWLPLLPELPGWALDGTVFQAELSEDIRTFSDLANRPWALRSVKHTPHPYESFEDLEAQFAASIGSRE